MPDNTSSRIQDLGEISLEDLLSLDDDKLSTGNQARTSHRADLVHLGEDAFKSFESSSPSPFLGFDQFAGEDIGSYITESNSAEHEQLSAVGMSTGLANDSTTDTAVLELARQEPALYFSDPSFDANFPTSLPADYSLDLYGMPHGTTALPKLTSGYIDDFPTLGTNPNFGATPLPSFCSVQGYPDFFNLPDIDSDLIDPDLIDPNRTHGAGEPAVLPADAGFELPGDDDSVIFPPESNTSQFDDFSGKVDEAQFNLESDLTYANLYPGTASLLVMPSGFTDSVDNTVHQRDFLQDTNPALPVILLTENDQDKMQSHSTASDNIRKSNYTESSELATTDGTANRETGAKPGQNYGDSIMKYFRGPLPATAATSAGNNPSTSLTPLQQGNSSTLGSRKDIQDQTAAANSSGKARLQQGVTAAPGPLKDVADQTQAQGCLKPRKSLKRRLPADEPLSSGRVALNSAVPKPKKARLHGPQVDPLAPAVQYEFYNSQDSKWEVRRMPHLCSSCKGTGIPNCSEAEDGVKVVRLRVFVGGGLGRGGGSGKEPVELSGSRKRKRGDDARSEAGNAQEGRSTGDIFGAGKQPTDVMKRGIELEENDLSIQSGLSNEDGGAMFNNARNKSQRRNDAAGDGRRAQGKTRKENREGMSANAKVKRRVGTESGSNGGRAQGVLFDSGELQASEHSSRTDRDDGTGMETRKWTATEVLKEHKAYLSKMKS